MFLAYLDHRHWIELAGVIWQLSHHGRVQGDNAHTIAINPYSIKQWLRKHLLCM